MDTKAMVKVLGACYDKTLVGLSEQVSVNKLAKSYLQKYTEQKKAAKKICNMQITKCGTSEYITGLGGIITLPVAVRVKFVSVIYVRLKNTKPGATHRCDKFQSKI